ncbi:MAG: DUF3613 domain-containing protein [Gammaproteobacteria bacterium]|nr:DUF3613 domain-containing protein [Gammaproteobacteria bacterium]
MGRKAGIGSVAGWMLVASLFSCAAQAAEPAPLGRQTAKWLDLQRSNHAALGAARPLPGDAADRIYQRYLKSFSHPVPESYNRKRFVEQD